MDEFIQNVAFIGEGIKLTLSLLLGGIVFGLGLGTVLSILRHHGFGKSGINRFISVMRGTPVILQLSIVYFSFPALTGLHLSILVTGVLTFGLNSSAYIAEIIRSGLNSLPKGQFEAAASLHIPVWYIWKDIILPQVMNNVLPALLNETIALLKETALISTIGGMDLMRNAQSTAAEHFTYFLPLCIAGCYYYALVLLIEYAGNKYSTGVAHA
jgi:polar amino acid transport system permease protein